MALKYWRASFHAASTASEPLTVKNTRSRSPGASAARRAANSDGRAVAERPHREIGQREPPARQRPPPTTPPVADLHDEQAGQAVEKTPAVRVVDVAAFAALDHRNLAIGEGAQPSEVHPQMAMRLLL